MAAIQAVAAGLRKARVIDRQTMGQFDELCIAGTPEFDAKAIIRIRKAATVSQPVFAR